MEPTHDSVILPLSKIIRSKATNPSGVAKAKKLMVQAAQGGGKRGPLSVFAKGDGTFLLLDGGSTFAVAQDAQWRDITVRVLIEEQFHIEVAEKKARKFGIKKSPSQYHVTRKQLSPSIKT